MMEKYIISKFKKNSFFEKKFIHFVNVEIDPRLWYSRQSKKLKTLLTMYYHSTIQSSTIIKLIFKNFKIFNKLFI